MADINFTYDQAVKTVAPSVPNALCYTTGNTVEGKVQLKDTTNIRLSDDGVFTTVNDVPMFANYVNDISLFETAQVITTTSAETVIDMSLGCNIILNQNMNTNISFTKPVGNYWGGRFFIIKRVHDDTANVYDLAFQRVAELYYEGSVYHNYTQTPNAKDLFYGFIDSALNVTIRYPILNYSKPISKNNKITGGSVSHRALSKRAPKTHEIQPYVDGVESGSVLTGMLNQTLTAVGLKTDGNLTFTNVMDVIGCLVNRKDLEFFDMQQTIGTIDINLAETSLIKFTHNMDVTAINLTVPDPNKKYSTIIWRIKDGTADPRDIFFDPAIFTWDEEPVLTQTPYATDWIQIVSLAGVNFLTVGNNFGYPEPARRTK